jgi:integrase
MTAIFHSPVAGALDGFLAFKRTRGYGYVRAEFMLRSFDRFLLARQKRQRSWRLGEAILAWLGRQPGRKAISVGMELAVIREFWRYLHRRAHGRFSREPLWPKLPSETSFVAHVLSPVQVRHLLRLIDALERPRFRRALYRTLFLVLYCTGIRFGEALRLRVRDLDLRGETLFILEFKGRSRWVPFHASLGIELKRYLRARRVYVGLDAKSEDRLFIGNDRRRLTVNAARWTISKLYRTAGLKPACGRIGPRPYDVRHTFAVHRLERWYRQGVDLHSRLPWLSAYLGHVNMLGTETYLKATPELLAMAGRRFRRRYCSRRIP